MASGFGDRLRQAREAQKMAIEEVAARLNLKPAIVQALEEDQYQHLPSAAYARGYLRGYARLMRVDVEGFVHNEQLEDDGALIHPFSGLGTQKTISGGWVFKIAGYLIVGALGFWVVSSWQASLNDGRDKTISLESLTTDGSPGLEIDVGKLRTEKIAADRKTKVSEGSKTQTTAKISPLEVVGTQHQSPPQNIKPPQRRIEIQPVKQAWIEITDAAKKSLFYALAEPGEAISISGEQPFKLVLGNASEVSLRYDGKRVEINQFMHNGVARFTLDDKGAHP
ncbi:MAG: helix-turn-helix domain-containing protein [Gammaproteobacteria bacterium]